MVRDVGDGRGKSDVDWAAPWDALKLQHRLILVSKFTNMLNNPHVRATVLASALAGGSATGIDPAERIIQLKFTYRPDNEGVLPQMFSFDDMEVLQAPTPDGGDAERLVGYERRVREAARNGEPVPQRVYLQIEHFTYFLVW